ncbi:CHAT domain-containing protein [uncultured Microscilla sp.]|uniref:CHAT domain-containing protein n=1 Tax=uncultured Microscilla sp. TaxID=432653 RepID=UPI00261B5BE6|nr:CHAT domain-containing tetratricopeptide repeat protein [uncultured Microscilla sp.]
MRHLPLFITILILSSYLQVTRVLAQISPINYQQKVDSLVRKRKYLLANKHLVRVNKYYRHNQKWDEYLANYKQILINLIQAQELDAFEKKAKKIQNIIDTLNHQSSTFTSFLFSSLGYLHELKGNTKKAIEYDLKALDIYIKQNSYKSATKLYINIGNSYEGIGAFNIAEQYLNEAISILKQAPSDSILLGTTYNNLSIVCSRKRTLSKALKFAQMALAIRKKVLPKNHPHINNSYQLLGLVYSDLEQYQKALLFFKKTLLFREKKYSKQHPLVATSNLQLANVYQKQKKYDLALQHYQKAQQIWSKSRKYQALSNLYNFMAKAYHTQKNHQKALLTYQKALCYNSKTFKDSSNVAVTPGINEYNNGRLFMETLRGKAAVLVAKGDAGSLEVALKTYQLCDELIQKFRQQYVRHQDKLMLAKISAEVYENALVTCYRLMRQQRNKEALYTQLAFHFSERNKASILREALQEANARFGLPQQLVDQEQDLKVNLAYYTKQLANAQARKDSVKINRYQNKLFDLNQQHEQLTQTLEKNYPSYYQLKYKTALVSLKRIQQSLPAQALLVEYFTTPHQLYAFAVSKTQAKMLALPGGKAFHGIIRKYGRSIKTRKRAGDFAKASYQAYQTLMAPLEPYMGNKTQIIVICDGKLLGVPFEPLISKKAPDLVAQFAGLDFMIKKYQFFYHYSANLMVQKMLRKQPAQRNDFLGMAPVFTKNSQGNTRDESANQPPQALPYTEKEIDKISDVFKQNGRHQIKSVLHTQATEQSFKTIGQQYKYIHLATHSVTNAQQPELAYIQFEPTPKSKDSYNEGKLYANEIYALSLNADLVVLSSCESGSGKIERGEGMMGLNRSFLYAGARHVMYSLWKVKDRPTSEFMISFYKKLVVGKHSFSKALQLAKQEYIKTHPLKRPHDWAGFLIIGQL